MEVNAIGRLRPGISEAHGRADLSRVARLLRERFPDVNEGFDIVSTPSSQWVASDTTRRALWILMGAVACLLLIAAVNLVNLLLAQATGVPRLVALATEVQAELSELIAHIAHPAEVLGHSNAEHARIVDALAAHDEERAVALVRRHLEGTEHILAGLMP